MEKGTEGEHKEEEEGFEVVFGGDELRRERERESRNNEDEEKTHLRFATQHQTTELSSHYSLCNILHYPLLQCTAALVFISFTKLVYLAWLQQPQTQVCLV